MTGRPERDFSSAAVRPRSISPSLAIETNSAPVALASCSTE